MTSPVMQPPVAEPPSSWIKDLIDKRYQPQNERIKRTPVGFNFNREPFDPSSYYNQLNELKGISTAATNIVNQESLNRDQKNAQAAFEASQSASNNALSGVNANYTYNGASRTYHLGGVSKTTATAADYFGNKYGVKNIGGRGPGSVPGSDHPKGRALDFMVYKNRSQGTTLANDVIRNWKKFNVKYVIWYHYIWFPGRGWHKYSGPSPHTDHVHVSFNN